MLSLRLSLKFWKKDTAEVTTDHFGLQVLADLQSERALSLGFSVV